MSDANAMTLAFVEETTFAETPSSALQKVRFTSENLRMDTESTESDEIRDDGQVADIIRTNLAAAGDINTEFSYGTYDDWMEKLQGSAGWSTGVAVQAASTDIGFTSGTKTIDLGSGSWTHTPTANEWIKVSGSTSNDGVYKVASATSNTIVVTQALTTEAATASITITEADQVVSGTALDTYSFEKEMTDESNVHVALRGMGVTGWLLELQSASKMTGRWSFAGKSQTRETSAIGNGSKTAATTTDIMNAVDHVTFLQDNGTPADITQFSFNMQRQLIPLDQVATLGATELGVGSFSISGSLRAYFGAANTGLLDKYLNWTETDIAISLKDAANNRYVFEFPAVRFTAAPTNAGGRNQQVILDISWAAKRDATEGIMARFCRWAA